MAVKNKVPRSVVVVALVIVFGGLAPLLDSTMINIAINNLQQSFNTSVTAVQWTVTGYLLATGVAVPFSSWLLNRFDGKKVFMAGEILFGVGSVLSALSTTINFLICARLIQGFAAGIIMPLLTTLIVQSSGKKVMGQMMATISLPLILGPLFGPIIGGFITNYLSWQWIFWVNVPIVLISILLILWKMPHYPAQNKSAKMDFIGIFLLIIFSSSIIYAIVEVAHEANFMNQTSLIYCVVGIIGLVLYLLWAAKKKNAAVLPLNLLTVKSFDGAIGGLFIAGTVLNGAMLLLPLYFQNIQKMTITMAAISLLPQGIGMLITKGMTGKLTDRFGAKYVVLVSLLITFVGTIPFYWIDSSTPYWLIATILFFRGIGTGGILMPLMTDAYTEMAKDQVPAATIGSRIIQNVGGAFGSALITTVVTAYATSQGKQLMNQLKHGAIHVDPAHLQAYSAAHRTAIELQAYQNGFLVISIAALLIIVPTIFLTNRIKESK